ncbi:hypothetical protein V1503_19000 [Bacillus sp. SCS-151]
MKNYQGNEFKVIINKMIKAHISGSKIWLSKEGRKILLGAEKEMAK